MATKEITLLNGEVVAVDTKIIALTLFKLQHEGVLNKEFLNMLTMRGNGSGDVDINMDIFTAINSVYVAYRQANPTTFLAYESFMELYEFDYEEAMGIFSEIIQKEAKKSTLADSFEKRTTGAGK
ncbi:hypothetical protein [Listeria fleischmannii]|uniref:Uncharacterized protein n=1 Tax=Listeria fleischmannii FSL S10-1203 TaxID=1265822 RepID=W7DF32_9LIST|nr:hypothetical protein [Listeria fleischmannii]EUJ56624.1 hypothetical protein MCOL2_08861 [Listeria fleischmannii FSL S10-1203]